MTRRHTPAVFVDARQFLTSDFHVCMGMMWDLEREQAAADAERPDLDITQPTPEEGITAMPSPMGPELRGLTGFILHHEVQ